VTIRNNIENIYVNINSVRLGLKDLSFRTDLSEDWFNEMYSLLFKLEQGTDIINNKYKGE
tara:strand:- start:126 stop:305 length:180 start_codon:yes stop_codon:yes gene_type:complete